MDREKRLIDPDKFLQWVIKRFKCVPLVGSCDNDSESMKLLLSQAPTVDAVEVVHGTWLDWHGNPVSPDEFYRWWRCSECKYQYVFDEAVKKEHFPSNYCPNCGAKMDGGKDNDT